MHYANHVEHEGSWAVHSNAVTTDHLSSLPFYLPPSRFTLSSLFFPDLEQGGKMVTVAPQARKISMVWTVTVYPPLSSDPRKQGGKTVTNSSD